MRVFFSILLAISASYSCRGEEATFTVALIPIVDAKKKLTVKYHDGTITIRHRNGTRQVRKLDALMSEAIEKAIVSAPTDQWKGFWQTVSIDGDIVIGKIERDSEIFTFRGLNGCPPGFAAILSTLGDAAGRQLFGVDWKKQETESEYLEKSPFLSPESPKKDSTPANEKNSEQETTRKSAAAE